ncbi:MAG: type II toxin-antitoxin system HicA family toxin [Treponema sp.]|nr:type II toxin-antitoxin system HicA family toxin [Treponema sp.]
MAEYEKKVRQVLAENHCYFKRRGKGDHDIWYSPISNQSFPVDSKIKSRHLANTIMKQAGITRRF